MELCHGQLSFQICLSNKKDQGEREHKVSALERYSLILMNMNKTETSVSQYIGNSRAEGVYSDDDPDKPSGSTAAPVGYIFHGACYTDSPYSTHTLTEVSILVETFTPAQSSILTAPYPISKIFKIVALFKLYENSRSRNLLTCRTFISRLL
jgi:hypothetical protein